jgi:hypothetical protein
MTLEGIGLGPISHLGGPEDRISSKNRKISSVLPRVGYTKTQFKWEQRQRPLGAGRIGFCIVDGVSSNGTTIKVSTSGKQYQHSLSTGSGVIV